VAEPRIGISGLDARGGKFAQTGGGLLKRKKAA
jgi:hypothetical protein